MEAAGHFKTWVLSALRGAGIGLATGPLGGNTLAGYD